MSTIPLSLNVNGRDYTIQVEPYRTLLEVLREDLRLTGTKANCLEGECGVCTVLIDGMAVNACIMLAIRARGRRVLTVEGLGGPDSMHPLQQAFIEHAAVQCGYCIPGMLMSAAALLAEEPAPDDEAILDGLAGTLCRCTGYVKIIQAVQAAARQLAANPSGTMGDGTS
ncbi:MAG: (2Fe-2S)-binding protein [Ardenticatenaceae bacterium]|nr:(2Fe-2S)-binding protein [Ardenticatenaceae bacterium]HBY94130.1 (2Fe-2S)-binding protein [Chloroflexota bacterium]